MQWRKRAKLSISAFGARLGVTQQGVSWWEQGKGCPSFVQSLGIAIETDGALGPWTWGYKAELEMARLVLRMVPTRA